MQVLQEMVEAAFVAALCNVVLIAAERLDQTSIRNAKVCGLVGGIDEPSQSDDRVS